MTEPMALTVNGQPHTMADGSTVSQLLDTLQIKPERVVVEVNLKILKRHEHHDARLRSGDQVEIVRFVGGGSVAILSSTPQRTQNSTETQRSSAEARW